MLYGHFSDYKRRVQNTESGLVFRIRFDVIRHPKRQRQRPSAVQQNETALRLEEGDQIRRFIRPDFFTGITRSFSRLALIIRLGWRDPK